MTAPRGRARCDRRLPGRRRRCTPRARRTHRRKAGPSPPPRGLARAAQGPAGASRRRCRRRRGSTHKWPSSPSSVGAGGSTCRLCPSLALCCASREHPPGHPKAMATPQAVSSGYAPGSVREMSRLIPLTGLLSPPPLRGSRGYGDARTRRFCLFAGLASAVYGLPVGKPAVVADLVPIAATHTHREDALVVHPHLEGDLRAVRGERRSEVVDVVVGELVEMGAVWLDREDLGVPALDPGEGDPLALGTEFREPGTAGDMCQLLHMSPVQAHREDLLGTVALAREGDLSPP